MPAPSPIRSVGPLAVVAAAALSLPAQEPGPQVVRYHGYAQAVELKHGAARAVLCPEVGGRVLEFTVDGRNVLYLSEEEKARRPSRKEEPATAGRFDYGPELTAPRHPKTWAGEWSFAVTGPDAATLTSPKDDPAGVRLRREFRLVPHGRTVGLLCTQTMTNGSPEVREVCHWGRSFSPGGGTVVIPLDDRPSRFPGKYAMYEEGSTINVRPADPNIRIRDGFVEVLGPPRKPKLGFDSYAGWLGYVMPDGTLFVKRYRTYPDRVYNEAAGLTISVWYPPGLRVELEPIGPRERLKPGESASFTEEWWVLRHPFPKDGEKLDLKALAEQVMKETPEPR